MQIYGSEFSGIGTPTIVFDGGGISVSNVSVASESEVTANFSVSCSAAAYDVYLIFPSDDNLTTNHLSVGIALPNAPAPSISFGGNDVTNTTQSVVIGQQIALTGNTPSLPACLSVSSQTWSFPGSSYPGNYVGGYSASGGSYSAPTLNQQATTFYWVTQGSPNATFTLNYNTGQQASSQVAFNAGGPAAVSVAAQMGQWQITQPVSGPQLSLGFAISTPGIQFSASAQSPANDTGTYEWAQIINTNNQTFFVGSSKLSCSPGTGLDNAFPFPGGTQFSAADSPAVGLPSSDTEVTWSWNATMFYMWDPDLSGSIPVPLGNVSWQGFGDAALNGSWTVQSDSSQSAGGFVQSSTFPTWTNVVLNGAACK